MAAGWVGSLDRIDPDGVVEGWCWRPDAPAARASIVLKVDGIPVASARCDCMRPDLAAAGFGDGAYGFLIVLPDATVRAGGSPTITLHDAETGRLLDRSKPLFPDTDMRQGLAHSAAQPVEGNLDGVSSEGIVTGWCWHPMQPQSRASVTVAADGLVIGTIRADGTRPDLLKAGIGDGSHGFSFALPSSLLDFSGIITIAVADAATGQSFGVPCVANPGRLSATNERVADLEHEIRRLQADYAALTAQIADREATSPAHDLLATLGILFTDLAREHATLISGQTVARRDTACDTGIVEQPGLVLAITAEPRATIIVPATVSPPCVLACLTSLHEQKIDEQAEIIVVASKNACFELAFLHGLVGNLHLVENRSVTLAEVITKLARPDIPAIVLAPIVRPSSTWLDLLIATASRHSNAGIVGGNVIGQYDELLRHAALEADLDDLPVATDAFDCADKFSSRHLRQVEAVGGLSFLITERGISSLRHQSGILPSPSSPGDDALDICLRLRQVGLDVLVQPQASAVCADEADLEPYIPNLRRSPSQLLAAWSARTPLRRNRGTALLIVDHIPRDNDPALSIRFDTLRALRMNIVVASVLQSGVRAVSENWIEASGVAVLDHTGGGSIGAYLQSAGSDINLIEFVSGMPSDGLLKRVRTLSPNSAIFGAETSQSWPPLSADHQVLLRELVNIEATVEAQSESQGIAMIANFAEFQDQQALQALVQKILPALDVANPMLPVLVIATGNSRPIAQQIAGPGGHRLTICSLTDDSLRCLLASRFVVLAMQQTWPIQADRISGAQGSTTTWLATTGPIAMYFAADLPTVTASFAERLRQLGSDPIMVAQTPEDLVKLLNAALDHSTNSNTRSAAVTNQSRSMILQAAVVALYRDFVYHQLPNAQITPPA